MAILPYRIDNFFSNFIKKVVVLDMPIIVFVLSATVNVSIFFFYFLNSIWTWNFLWISIGKKIHNSRHFKEIFVHWKKNLKNLFFLISLTNQKLLIIVYPKLLFQIPSTTFGVLTYIIPFFCNLTFDTDTST